MNLKDLKLFFFFLCVSTIALAQEVYKGKIIDSQTNEGVEGVEIYKKTGGLLATTKPDGTFEIDNLKPGDYQMVFFSYQYKIKEEKIALKIGKAIQIALDPLGEQLTEVVLNQRKAKVFALTKLKPVEGTAIYAGKKSEVVLVDQTVGNLAANNPRQIYSQVVGLNIYENDDAGLQLNVGGRGLDPNRTSNFNTRQNGYDISADVLGYPESYYTPPAEALEKIQVVRGAASLQYGTQFGGLINFVLKKPNPHKKFELISRQTVGSNNLFTSFNSVSGTVGKVSYYTYFNFKEGDGFRPNSHFNSKNYYAHVGYQLSEKTKISGEFTYLKYLAQQPGGLTDTQFNEDPNFSNRSRNWFQVDWKLYAFKLEHAFSKKTDFSLQVFGLDAQRNALGYRGLPVNSPDPIGLDGNYIYERDLLKGKYQNWGAEARLLTRYNLGKQESVFLIGAKYYKASNSEQQGAGSKGTGADFTFKDDLYPEYPNKSKFVFPNENIAVFAENIFNITDKFSLTPGVRFEHIRTQSKGSYYKRVFDNAGNLILEEIIPDNRVLTRNFVLLGLGASYKPTDKIEMYGNFSQNYRSVTFSDIHTVNPSFIVDPNIEDEKGFTGDFGIRGRINNAFSYDVGGFGLLYDNRIGIVLVSEGPSKGDHERKNIGKAFIYGFESLLDWNLINTFEMKEEFQWNVFSNLAITSSEYLESEETNVEGNEVEFIPLVNLRAGMKFGYKNFLANLQYTYLSKQYTDAQNSVVAASTSVNNGIVGPIPSYDILDLSFSYTYKRFKLETGINNLLDKSYFTRRATGYPGPGIIPSAPRTYYATLQFKI
ncbi:TonB-dependent receptor domain-containing protein [Aureivirga sp. CE67]|uniref:TonB-dependent receptor domain-containing protein n=1 Tax=Aureivirga sp. CE67 TaxID=1788983 RepID=UPI0018C9FBAD|nr:TonB-dependent receptor [Aureivirga sp. CE67]